MNRRYSIPDPRVLTSSSANASDDEPVALYAGRQSSLITNKACMVPWLRYRYRMPAVSTTSWSCSPSICCRSSPVALSVLLLVVPPRSDGGRATPLPPCRCNPSEPAGTSPSGGTSGHCPTGGGGPDNPPITNPHSPHEGTYALYGNAHDVLDLDASVRRSVDSIAQKVSLVASSPVAWVTIKPVGARTARTSA